jgi:ABC-type long-subunit fatty acid transport system fused permease/ATPase subunit
MLSEFFLHRDPRYRAGAWLGMILAVVSVAYNAWVAYVMNAWMANFYDVLQNGSKALGDGEEVDDEMMRDYQDKVWLLIRRFLVIITPLILITPLTKFLINCWTYFWRLAMMNAYLDAWDTSIPPIEGAAQRVHEDTQRFASGLNTLAEQVLYAVLMLLVFSPILISVGKDVSSPFLTRWGVDLGEIWLLCFAWSCALGGLGVSVWLGRELVGLEVNNQKVEAVLRRDLVVLEVTPEKLVKADGCGEAFKPTMEALTQNYLRLYLNFMKLNAWLFAFEALISLVPFVLCAPLLFATDKKQRITLGTLTKLDNAFGKVFGALNTVSRNWV